VVGWVVVVGGDSLSAVRWIDSLLYKRMHPLNARTHKTHTCMHVCKNPATPTDPLRTRAAGGKGGGGGGLRGKGGQQWEYSQ
jgi:hypothetical protein